MYGLLPSPKSRAAAGPDYSDDAIGRYIGVVPGGKTVAVVRIATEPHLPGALTRFAFSDLGQVVQCSYLDLLLGKYAAAWHYGHKKQADEARRALDDRVVGTEPKMGAYTHATPTLALRREFILTARQGGFHLRLAHQLHHGAGYGAEKRETGAS